MKPISHLNDEQMYAALDGTASLEAQSHLVSCAACQSEVQVLGGSLLNFRNAATNLAAANSPALPFRTAAIPRRHIALPRLWVGSLVGATAALAITISVLHPVQVAPAVTPSPTATVTEQAASYSDDALLDGIQQDISTSIPPSLEPLSVSAGTSDNLTQN